MTIVQRLTDRPHATMRLFCFPYAGGAASAFRPWRALPEEIEVYAIQLSGREDRFAEEPVTELAPILDELERAFTRYTGKPFAFFGHSLGALVGWEFARRLRRLEMALPAHTFVSGARAPQCPRDADFSGLSDAELVEHVRDSSAAPARVLENTELMLIFARQLRADFRLAAGYKYRPDAPLDCEFSVFGGVDDGSVGPEHLEAWAELTTAPIRRCMFPGEHFFLHSAREEVLREVSSTLDDVLRRQATQ
ncbi:MAG TPA: alpha/beta fold hydrolase [Candidatus Limnocylindrales bacterium]|nr:alpha/beta fold hydrolase [Candidatus Limnocylindrales bacterium]